MLKLYFDTETTGLWKYGPDNPADGPMQPFVCEFAWTLVDGDGTEIEAKEHLVKPDGWTLTEELTRIHGITTEMCAADGKPLADVSAELHAAFLRADLICAYGITFDMKGARASFRRCGLPDLYEETKDKTFCVMKAASEICRMPPTERMVKAGRSGQWKTPKLAEAAKILLGLDHTEKAHRALADVRMTMLVHKHLFELRAKAFDPVELADGAMPDRAPVSVGRAKGRAPAADSGLDII